MVGRLLCRSGKHRWTMQSRLKAKDVWIDQPTYPVRWPTDSGHIDIRARCLRCNQHAFRGDRL